MITAFKILALFTLITGVTYPILVTGVSQVLLNSKANGSLFFKDQEVLGSELIGQTFSSDKYFKSRPSAVNYDPSSSGATNLSVTSNKFVDSVNLRGETFKSSDLLTSSGSGLDPHISPSAAYEQVEKVLIARGLDLNQKEKVIELIKSLNEGKTLGFMGSERVNVLKLNVMLDEAL